MKFLAGLILALSSFLISGSNTAETQEPDLLQQTQEIVAKYDKNEVVSKIHRVNYYKLEGNFVTMVYYYSNLGYSNLVMVSSESGPLGEKTNKHEYTMKCKGNCPSGSCISIPIVNDNGQLEGIECSCQSCKLHVLQGD